MVKSDDLRFDLAHYPALTPIKAWHLGNERIETLQQLREVGDWLGLPKAPKVFLERRSKCDRQ